MGRPLNRALVRNAVSIACCVVATVAAASATTWNVPGDGSNTCTIGSPNCDTIGQAVTASASNDTILIGAGSFPVAATLDLTKTLTIAGAGMASTTVQPSGGLVAFEIRADGIVIRDLTIQGGSVGVRFPVASDDTELDSVTFSGNTSRGVEISPPAATPVTNVRIVDCTVATPNIGLRMSSESTVTDLSITGTTFDGNAYGIYQANDGNSSQLSNLTISDCAFTNNTAYGIYAEEMRDAVIEDSSFSGGTTGIGLLKFYSSNGLAMSNVTIRRNEFAGFKANALDLEIFALGLGSPIAIEDNTFEKDVAISTAPATVFVRLHPTLPNAAVNFLDNSFALSGTFGAATSAHAIQLRGNGPVVITGNVLDGGNVGGSGTTPPSSGLFIQSRSGGTIMPATTNISASCNRIQGFRNAVSVFDSFAGAYGGLPVGATVTLADNAMLGNDHGVVTGAVAPTIDAENNYWGCAAGPGDPACDDVVGDVDADPFRSTIPACVACLQDSECDDALFCTGVETCALGVCAAAGDPCAGGPECENLCNEAADDCVVPAATVCRPAAGDCDLEESCDGLGGACPADAFALAGTECRSAAGFCDVAEACDGATADCPADAKLSIECRASVGVCDPAESCDGIGNDCPADGKSTAECRAAGGLCDAAESCDGVGDDCPPDLNQPDGTQCADGLFCNGDDTCLAGACTSGPAPCGLSCDEGTDTCLAVCPLAPQLCASAAKSLLLVKDKDDNTRDKLVWKWIKGAATMQSDFADPTTTADYALCIYAGVSPALVGGAIVPADAVKWSLLSSKGYKYKDQTPSANGIAKVLLKGGEQDKAKALVKGKGDGLPDLPLPLTAPVTVQLINGDNGLCWGSTFSAPQLLKNDTAQLKAKAQTP